MVQSPSVMTATDPTPHYALGSTDAEHERLIWQAARLAPLTEQLFREAERQLTVCNACRYCEGLCPVFPALERRNVFLEGDVLYLANLCHDCRACMPACPYTEPHELAIDIPGVLAQVRKETYATYAFPKAIGEVFVRRTQLPL